MDSDLVVEDTVDKSLEDCRCVLESEWHDVVLTEASGCLEGRLPLVPFSDSDGVEAGPEVELGEDPGLAQGRQCLGEWGDRIFVFLAIAD